MSDENSENSGDGLSFVALSGALRNEKSDELHLPKLPDKFDDRLAEYANKKRDDIKKALKTEKPGRSGFGARVAEEHERELANAKKIVSDLFNLRARKIVLTSLDAEASILDSTNMTMVEKRLFKKAQEAIEVAREAMVYEPFTRKTTPKKSQNVKNETKTVTVRMLSDIPAFVGVDGESSYGPYKKDDVAEIPEMNARILLEKKKATTTDVGDNK